MRKALIGTLFLALSFVAAHAASINLSISITSPPSTAVTVTPVAPFSGSGANVTAVGPIASGVTVGTISVAPSGWQGALALSGTNATSFSLSGTNLVTAATLAAGTSYAVTITASP